MSASARLAGLAPQTIRALQESARASSRGDASTALQYAQAAAGDAPTHPEVLRRLALTQVSTGHRSEAIETISSAVEQRPDDAVLAYAQAIVLHGAGRSDAALDAMRRAHQLDPASIDIAMSLGRALRDAVLDEEAAAVFERVLAAAPAHRDARANLAWVLARLGQTQAAIDHYRGILRAHPDDARIWLALAELNRERLDAGDVAVLERLCDGKNLA
ncbi:MAG TPA: tetratricopeptide repeat protein, partial [Rudaea sp.]